MPVRFEAPIAAALVAVDAVDAVGGGGDPAASADPLASYRWTSRVLLLAAPEAGDARLLAQCEALAAARTGSAERALVVVEAVGSGERAMLLRRRFHLPNDAFRAVLVGKDGGAKLSSSEPIPPQRLFATIDAMPMRRNEMRQDEMLRDGKRNGEARNGEERR